jgi:soluble lytic murein transglycosylase-like protein
MLEGIGQITERIQDITERMRKLYDYTGETRQSMDSIGDGMTAKSTEFQDMIRATSARYGVDQNLVKSVISVESNFKPEAVSPKGAAGLMQLMPGTAQELGVNDVFDPSENIEGGTRYLKGLLDRYGNDVEKALAAYNAGPGAVDRAGGSVPQIPETQDYVRKVLETYRNTQE